ncbi:hypothetical protein QTH89_11490 [Variovorax sp. J22G21]|uniref:hypothetical protein n=1 Tax=Variovorax fucosicus TaxID=3053517 RepID=UPI00257652D8|nr:MULTISPECIES: hypothetical protein [unclassified Variovorax]MDM0040453.1 hypothetical protein [Variovorax sp. J22R193]MDM0061826.1 hypothetical protein [Variovorax sp. J22G21]
MKKTLKLALVAATLATSSIGWAQDGKAALVKQLIDLQRPGIEVLARSLVEDSSAPIAQAGSGYLQSQVPAEKREAAAKAADAELKKYFDEAYPILRDKAMTLAPTTLGPVMTDNFSEDELRQLIAWLSSPLRKKYDELNPKMGEALTKQLVAETKPTIEPKLRALDASVAKALGAPTSAPAGAQGKAPAAAPAKAPAKK